jgi:hypothetical protein
VGDDRQTVVLDLAVVEQWTARLNSSIFCLGAILRPCAQLRHYKLEARPEHHEPGHGLVPRAYLAAPALISLLSVGHLTTLHIDMGGTYFTRLPRPSDGIHLCSTVNTLLPTLRRIRCRMCSICDDLLEPPAGDKRLCLEEVIINLSLSELSDFYTSYRYPTGCWPVSGETASFQQLRSSVERQVRTPATRLENPKMVRVLSHTFPALQVYAYDALADQRILLASDAPWNADGEVAEEDAPSAEIDLFENDDAVDVDV